MLFFFFRFLLLCLERIRSGLVGSGSEKGVEEPRAEGLCCYDWRPGGGLQIRHLLVLMDRKMVTSSHLHIHLANDRKDGLTFHWRRGRLLLHVFSSRFLFSRSLS